MGRKATITESDVLAAIHKIRTTGVAGGSISAKNIRKVTGTGSLTTIIKLLKSIEESYPDIFRSTTVSENSSSSGEIEKYLRELKDKVDFLPKLLLQEHRVDALIYKEDILKLEQKVDELQEAILSRDKEIERLNMLIKNQK